VPILVAALVVLGALVAGGSVLAAPSTDASVNNYQQCANNYPGSATDPTDCVPQGWINGILNANNSQYTEDQVTAQRLGLDVPSGGPLTDRTITIKYLARKGQGGGGNHAYDSLATWNFTQTNADRCQDLAAADCPGDPASTSQIPSDPTIVADSNGAGDSTANHELPATDRLMTMYGGTITGVSVPVHDNASGSGDDYAQITVTYSVAAAPAKVQLLFGGHLAASVGPRGWGANVGSSFINGGPYHIKLVQLDSSSVGNRDNQITSGAILPTGTQTQTALHETDANGVDVNPANNEDPVTSTGISVTLPTNGSGTYVTDYATVAPSNSTGTVAFRYYSSQAVCTADTAFTGGTSAGSGKSLDGSGVAKSDTIHITAAGVTYWRAVFTGTGLSSSSDSGCSNEILTANQATSTISPHITVVKTPDEQVVLAGSTVSFTIQVINDGDSTLTDVKVTDAQAPGCARTSADIAGLALMKPAPDSSGTITYTCTLANVTASFTNTAVATGTPPVGPPVSSQDTAHVTVVQPVTHPSISIVKNPKAQNVTVGNKATFKITVTNNGDTALTNVVVSDPLSPDCDRTIGDLAPGASVSYSCTRPNVRSDFTNVATATGTAGTQTVTAKDTAPVNAVKALTPPPTVKPKVVSHKKPKATG
jgi:uncharacterized repeat protein (TIGR01451 family)